MTSRTLAILALALVPAVPAGASAQAPAGHGAAAGERAGSGRARGTLLVEISAGEGTLAVAQALYLNSGDVPLALPLLLPESGPLPVLRERVGEDETGISMRGRGGAQVKIEGGRVIVTGRPASGADFGAEVQYQIPVDGEPLVLSTVPSLDLVRVQVVHRGGPWALQVRPLVPFRYREENEGDGTWRYQDLSEGVAAGSALRVAVGRVPAASGPFRSAGLALLGAVVAGATVLALRRRG